MTGNDKATINRKYGHRNRPWLIKEIGRIQEENERLREGIELAWAIIANSCNGDWDSATNPKWKPAAEKWRDTWINGPLEEVSNE